MALAPRRVPWQLAGGFVATADTTAARQLPDPLARYNDRARKDCNLEIPLWNLVRASTDRELGDMIPRRGDPITGAPLPLEEDCGRQFLYARFDPDLSRAGLDALGLSAINPADVEAIDAVANIRKMQDVGRAYTNKCVETAPFKTFQ